MQSEPERQLAQTLKTLESAEKQYRAHYLEAIDQENLEEAFAIQQDMTRYVRQIKAWKESINLLLAEMQENPIL